MIGSSGMAERLFSTLYMILGGIRGGLAITVIVVATVFAACTGVIAASVTTMGIIAMAPMVARGYDKSLASGAVAAGGTLGILIPPSIMIVIYGPMAEVSVGKMFAGAIFPGLVLSSLYVLYIVIFCRVRPNAGPPIPVEERHVLPASRQLAMVLMYMVPPLGIIFAVLGTILFGVATPTEAAGMGAFASLIVAAAFKSLNWKSLRKAISETLRITAFAGLLTIGAGVFASIFLYLRGGEFVTAAVTGVPGGRWGSFVIIMLVIYLLGMFIEWIGSIYIVVPVFTPIGAALGFDPVWFAIMICIAYQTGFLSPPNAHAIFYLKAVSPPEVTIGDIIKGVVPFIGLVTIGLILCIIFPSIITWLPSVTVG
jgi:tripartite ATP-independent transporter DctM subunit